MSIKYDHHNSAYIDVGGGFIIRLEKDQLNEAQQERAKIELRETPENVEIGKRELKELLKSKWKL